MVQDGLCDRSQQERPLPRPLAGADQNQIRFNLVCFANDHGRRVTVRDQAFRDRDTFGRQLPGDLPKLPACDASLILC
jgi:hypothetical protein